MFSYSFDTNTVLVYVFTLLQMHRVCTDMEFLIHLASLVSLDNVWPSDHKSN